MVIAIFAPAELQIAVLVHICLGAFSLCIQPAVHDPRVLKGNQTVVEAVDEKNGASVIDLED